MASAETAVTYPADASFAAALATTPVDSRRDWSLIANRVLKSAAASWFSVAVVGQIVFVVYMLGFYARNAVLGQMDVWNKVFPRAYVPGDPTRNLVVSLHLIFATLVIIAGALQLIPAVRRQWPRFHRWSGRAYLVAALVASTAGLIMTWTRTSGGDMSMNVSISINAVLVIAFAGLAYHFARARRIDVHRRWALRLFLTMLGAWFFRVGLLFWLIVNHGPVGFDPDTFQGPFLTSLSFAQYLLPLAVLELYLRAQDHGGLRSRFAVAGVIFAFALVTAIGVFGASMALWLPHLNG